MAPKSIRLDLCGLKCPLPVLHTRRALARLAPGDTITVLCTDPLAGIDIPHLARSEGNRLEHQEIADGVATFIVCKGPGDPGGGGQPTASTTIVSS